MTIDPDEVARAGVLAWELFASAITGASTERRGGVLAVRTGVPLPGFNGIWGESREVDPEVIGQVLDEMQRAGVPHCMQLRPGWLPEVDEVARERGLERVQGEPIMVLDDSVRLSAWPQPEGLIVRRLSPDEGALHARVAAMGEVVGNEAAYSEVATPALLGTEGVRCYVGEVGGEAVTTAVSVTAGGAVGIFSVATLPAHRRLGYGSAVTARAARDGFAAAASWAWLSASDAGYRVYRALGFETVERLDFWLRRRQTAQHGD